MSASFRRTASSGADSSIRITPTPSTPSSPLSCTPLALASFQTRPRTSVGPAGGSSVGAAVGFGSTSGLLVVSSPGTGAGSPFGGLGAFGVFGMVGSDPGVGSALGVGVAVASGEVSLALAGTATAIDSAAAVTATARLAETRSRPLTLVRTLGGLLFEVEPLPGWPASGFRAVAQHQTVLGTPFLRSEGRRR